MKHLLALLTVLFAVTWSGAAESLPQIDAQPFFPPRHLKRLAYFEQITSQAYRSVGSRNSRWDRQAEAALALYARFLCFEQAISGTTNFECMVKGFKSALDAGCDDPLVRYAALRLRPRESARGLQPERENFQPILDGLKLHPYPASLQAAIYLHAALSELRGARDKSRAKASLEASIGQLAQAMRQAADREDVHDLAPQLFSAYKAATGDREPLFDLLQARLASPPGPTNALALAIAGRFYADWALDARTKRLTNNAARHENEDVFFLRLDHAKDLLRSSWEMDPSDPLVCRDAAELAAMAVDETTEFEQWFQRGKDADPVCYSLFLTKLNYLSLRWHGGKKAALKFGKECLSAGDWLNQLPLILVDAHQRFGSDLKDPEVWKDFQTVYETYLRRYPGNNVVRSAYCYFACKAERWLIAKALLAQLGELAVKPLFHGQYDQCVEAVRKHT